METSTNNRNEWYRLLPKMDEGIMPQTSEHVNILNALQVSSGIVVLTKYDMVEPEEAERIEQEIREGLKGTVCSEWPFVMASSLTGYGLEDLKHEIAKKAKHLSEIVTYPGVFDSLWIAYFHRGGLERWKRSVV